MSMLFSSDRDGRDDEGSMFGPRRGSWSVSSIKDPRWNGSGSSPACGGFVIPEEAQAHIDKLKATLGPMPDDLAWSYMKD